MACNRPQKSWRSGKKRVVRACSRGREKTIHFGAVGYGHNYSPAARRSFRARHKCGSARDKLTARYWACKNLWTKGGSSQRCPSNRKCKRKSRKRPVGRVDASPVGRVDASPVGRVDASPVKKVDASPVGRVDVGRVVNKKNEYFYT
jgi:hypothetical protein